MPPRPLVIIENSRGNDRVCHYPLPLHSPAINKNNGEQQRACRHRHRPPPPALFPPPPLFPSPRVFARFSILPPVAPPAGTFGRDVALVVVVVWGRCHRWLVMTWQRSWASFGGDMAGSGHSWAGLFGGDVAGSGVSFSAVIGSDVVGSCALGGIIGGCC